MIGERAGERVAGWIAEAVGAGAKLLTGGDRDGAAVAPAALAEAPPDAKVVRDEVFGPVLVVQRTSGTGACPRPDV